MLNKPPGLPSQGGSGQGDRHVDGLTEALKFGYKDRPKLVHRLDKDTSGVLMLARTDRVARALSEALRHRNTRKIYWAVVAGVPNPRKGSIKYGLMKAPGRGRGGEGEKMVCIHPAKMADYPDAKRAQTDFFVLWFLGTRLSWMALEPITGPHPSIARPYGRDWAIRSWAMASTAVRAARIKAMAGAPRSAATSAARCICMRGC